MPSLQRPRGPGPRSRSTDTRRGSIFQAPWPAARKAFGVTFTCDSDAHSVAALSNVSYAVGQARRAWLEAADVLNTRSLEDVLTFVGPKTGLGGSPCE